MPDLPVRESTVESVCQFVEAVNADTACWNCSAGGTPWFRGQTRGDCPPLPSILRAGTGIAEHTITARFRALAPMFGTSPSRDKKDEWLTPARVEQRDHRRPGFSVGQRRRLPATLRPRLRSTSADRVGERHRVAHRHHPDTRSSPHALAKGLFHSSRRGRVEFRGHRETRRARDRGAVSRVPHSGEGGPEDPPRAPRVGHHALHPVSRSRRPGDRADPCIQRTGESAGMRHRVRPGGRQKQSGRIGSERRVSGDSRPVDRIPRPARLWVNQ